MNRIFILIITALLLFSGCVDDKVVKKGDNISIDYTGSFENGKVFETSIESVAKANSLDAPGAQYKPLKFTVGKTPRDVIEGLDEGVIGMRVGDTKKLTIPTEKAYPIDPDLIQVTPIVQNLTTTRVIPKVFELPLNQFVQFFGSNHSAGDSVRIPETNLNITVINMTPEVSLKYDLDVGSNIWDARAPWNETVIKIDEKNITIKSSVKENDTVQFQGAPFNSTVIDLDEKNITIRHNRIPETTIAVPGMFGQMMNMKVSFNETSVIMDQNMDVAGKTLIFDIKLISIDE